jgi:hypothetical protein
MDVTAEELAAALAKSQITVEEPEISNSVHGGPNGWQPLWAKGAPMHPHEVAIGLLSSIGLARSLTADELAGELTHKAVTDDPELAAMAALLPALPLVSRLKHSDARRVMEWFTHRACDDLPPF